MKVHGQLKHGKEHITVINLHPLTCYIRRHGDIRIKNDWKQENEKEEVKLTHLISGH